MNTNYTRLRFNAGTVSVLNSKQNRVLDVFDTTPEYAQADPINARWLINGYIPTDYECPMQPLRFPIPYLPEDNQVGGGTSHGNEVSEEATV